MSTCIITAPNIADLAPGGGTLTGGAWTSTYPLANLLDPDVKKPARSSNLLAASTQFTRSFSTSRWIDVLGLPEHNLSPTATHRVTVSDSSSFSPLLYDSVFANVWADAVPREAVMWEDWEWTGRPNADQLQWLPKLLAHVLPQPVKARYLKWEIVDSTNAAGYVQAGRLFVGLGWRTAVNFDYGASQAYESRTQGQQVPGGTKFFEIRRAPRVRRFTLGHLTEDEALGHAQRIQLQADVHGEVFFIWNDSPRYQALRSMHGRVRTLNAIEHWAIGAHRAGYEIEEVI